MIKLICLTVLGFASLSAYAGKEAYGPINVDGGHISCKSFGGDEIKKKQAFRAPSDRFFEEKSISVRQISGWAPKKHGCDLSDVKKSTITLNSDAGPVDVSVVTEFSVYAYADCGTDVTQFAAKTASIECEASAVMIEFKK